MRKTLFESLTHGPLTEPLPKADVASLLELVQRVDGLARAKLGRSLSIRQVDAGSCNGCELEIHALNNAFYDLERLGLRFVASPRHADVLMVTGPVSIPFTGFGVSDCANAAHCTVMAAGRETSP